MIKHKAQVLHLMSSQNSNANNANYFLRTYLSHLELFKIVLLCESNNKKLNSRLSLKFLKIVAFISIGLVFQQKYI